MLVGTLCFARTCPGRGAAPIQRCAAEPGPIAVRNGPRISSAPLRPAQHPGNAEIRIRQNHEASLASALATIFRKQSRHRQSPPSSGIGNRATSSAHQHAPARLQVNSVPQPEQASRRDGGFSNRSVINRARSCPRFHVGFMSNRGIIR